MGADIFIRDWLRSSLSHAVHKTKSGTQYRVSMEAVTVLNALLKRFNDFLEVSVMTSTNVSSKFLALIETLLEYKSKAGFICICFVQKRHHCLIIAHLLQRAKELESFVVPAYLLGHGGNDR